MKITRDFIDDMVNHRTFKLHRPIFIEHTPNEILIKIFDTGDMDTLDDLVSKRMFRGKLITPENKDVYYDALDANEIDDGDGPILNSSCCLYPLHIDYIFELDKLPSLEEFTKMTIERLSGWTSPHVIEFMSKWNTLDILTNPVKEDMEQYISDAWEAIT